MTSQQQTSVLTSWKEIAAYLGKGVRTVQRWEYEFGLPVRRPSENRHIVHATREDLDAWLTSWSKRSKHLQGNDPAPRTPVPGIVCGLELSRELRETQRRLRSELLTSMAALTDKCRSLTAQMCRSLTAQISMPQEVAGGMAPLQKRKVKGNGAVTSE